MSWSVPNTYAGRTIVILGGGPGIPDKSIIDRLPQPIMVLKHAVSLRSDADIFFWAGRQWHEQFAPLIASFRGKYSIRRGQAPELNPICTQVSRMKYADPYFSLDPRLVGGYCVGGSAINIAAHFGAKRILLLGYNMAGGHWFPNHPTPVPSSNAHARHRAGIESMVPALRELGIEVINCTPKSALTCFPKGRIEDYV